MNRAAMALILVLAACGGTTSTTSDETGDTTTTTGPTTTTSQAVDNDGTTSTTGAETTTTASSGPGMLVIAAVNFDDGTYTLRNDGDAPIDLAGYFACNRPSYVELPAETLDPGDTLDISTGGLSISAADGELGVYNAQSFGSTSAIQAYVQWGSDSHGRTGTAVDAGVWTDGEFVDNGGASMVSSGSNPISASDWAAASP